MADFVALTERSTLLTQYGAQTNYWPTFSFHSSVRLSGPFFGPLMRALAHLSGLLGRLSVRASAHNGYVADFGRYLVFFNSRFDRWADRRGIREGLGRK